MEAPLDMPRLMVRSSEESIAVESFDLKLGVNKLGRDAENQLQIPSHTVSGSHCEIIWMSDSVLVRDLKSTNGTFIDGARIDEARLDVGQTLRVGSIELFLDTDKAAISVPDLTEAPKVAVAPPAGRLPCAQHGDKAAAYHCPTCQKDFCEACVHTLRLQKGHIHNLCPICSTHCSPIIYQEKRKRRSLIETVQNALGFSTKGQTQKM